MEADQQHREVHGSGALPINAYATLEHEHVLLFRKGGTRSFPPNDEDRYASAFFWEERNEWFSGCWEIRGTGQDIEDGHRERSGAFPLGGAAAAGADVLDPGGHALDPFVGTGTTSLAAMLEGRSSVGVEQDPELAAAFAERAAEAPALSTKRARERLERHRERVQ